MTKKRQPHVSRGSALIGNVTHYATVKCGGGDYPSMICEGSFREPQPWARVALAITSLVHHSVILSTPNPVLPGPRANPCVLCWVNGTAERKRGMSVRVPQMHVDIRLMFQEQLQTQFPKQTPPIIVSWRIDITKAFHTLPNAPMSMSTSLPTIAMNPYAIIIVP